MTDYEKEAGKKEYCQAILSDCFEQVKQIFSGFTDVKLIKVPVTGTLPQVISEKIAFLPADMTE